MVVLGISGSLRAGSLNTALLRAAAGLVPAAARLPLYTDLALVPPYSEDDDGEPAPAAVRRLRAGIESADALLIATPEYNASLPGQLKNALDWASRPYPDNALRRKPVAVVGASTGLFGAVWAQAELRKVLTTAGADVLDDELPIGNAEEAFYDDLRLADSELSARLERILASLVNRALTQSASDGKRMAVVAAGVKSGRERGRALQGIRGVRLERAGGDLRDARGAGDGAGDRSSP